MKIQMLSLQSGKNILCIWLSNKKLLQKRSWLTNAVIFSLKLVFLIFNFFEKDLKKYLQMQKKMMRSKKC